MKMQEEMAKFQGAGSLFNAPMLGGGMPQGGLMAPQGMTYTYGPNGELVPQQ